MKPLLLCYVEGRGFFVIPARGDFTHSFTDYTHKASEAIKDEWLEIMKRIGVDRFVMLERVLA